MFRVSIIVLSVTASPPSQSNRNRSWICFLVFLGVSVGAGMSIWCKTHTVSIYLCALYNAKNGKDEHTVIVQILISLYFGKGHTNMK